MELNTFVAQTLKEIVEGVVRAQNEVKELGATVNPRGAVNVEYGQTVVTDRPERAVQIIDFDISLTETESAQAGGRIGVLFGAVGLGAHGKAESGTNAMNRVKFSVPVALPAHSCPAFPTGVK